MSIENNDETQLYSELKGFLTSERSDLRLAATQAVLQVQDREGREKLVKHGLVEDLARNTSHPELLVAVNALRSLVFLSSDGTTSSQCIEDLMAVGTIPRMIEIVLAPKKDATNETLWRQQVNFAMALLANMTRLESGAVEVAGKIMPDEALTAERAKELGETPARPTLELLLSRFLNSHFVNDKDVDYSSLLLEKNDEALDSNDGDPFQHFASVLMNLSQVESGRRFVMRIHRTEGSPDSSVLQRLLPQLRSLNPLRRRGIAGMLRNCCHDSDSAWWLINVVKIVKHLLYPLAGPEELDVDEKQGLDPDLWLEGPDKKREPDHFTRLFLIEAILLLCASGRKSREQLRLERVYVILKWADMVEEEEDVSGAIFECVQFLRRDEEGTVEGSSDKFVADAYRKISAAPQVGVAREDLEDLD